MNDKEALDIIKKQFTENLKEGLLNLQIDWLIQQAEKIQRYEDALKFYANKDYYEVVDDTLNPIVSYIHIIDMDEGERARRALGLEDIEKNSKKGSDEA